MGRPTHLLKDEQINVMLSGHLAPSVTTVGDFWPSGLNNTRLDVLNSSFSEQCYFTKLCGIHLARLAPKSLIFNFRSRRGSSLDCKPCKVFNLAKDGGVACPPSSYETAAYFAVSLLPDELGISATDMLTDFRLSPNESSVDIYLPTIRLCIMVDGEGHFRDYRGSTVGQQQSIDDRFNKSAIKRGAKVLRLHYKDTAVYNKVIFIAVQRCSQGVYGKIDFSKSYNPEIRKAWRLKPL